MKKSLIYKLLAALALVAVVVLVDSLIGGVAGITLGTVVVAGEAVTEQQVRTDVPDLDMEDISQTVVEMNPARTPLDTIMRKIRKAEKIESMIKKFYSVGSEPLTDVIASDSTYGTYAYASGNGLTSRTFKVENPSIWAVDDTVLARDVTVLKTLVVGVIGTPANETTMDIVFYVNSISANGVELVPLNGIKGLSTNASTYVIPDLAAGAVLYRMGVAKNEMDIQHDQFALLPEPEDNYCQYFISQIEESTFQKMTKKEVNWGFSDYERQNLYSMKAKMEMSFLNGVKGLVYNTDKKNKRYTTEGVVRRVGHTLDYTKSAGVTQDNYLTWMETVFTGNSGSLERLLFAGSSLVRRLHKVDDIAKQLRGSETKVKWGIEVNEIVTNFGKLYIYHHPLLSLTGWKDNGLILDMEHVRKHEFMPMKVTDLDLITSGQRNAKARVIAEASCVTLQYPDCHGVIYGK